MTFTTRTIPLARRDRLNQMWNRIDATRTYDTNPRPMGEDPAETYSGKSHGMTRTASISCLDAVRAGTFVQQMTAQQDAHETQHGPMTPE